MPRNVLDAGTSFPPLSLTLVDGGTLSLPSTAHDFTVLLFNRGHWCPYCKTQLTAFQRALPALLKDGIQVVSASVDPLDKAQALVRELGLTFPVGFGLKVDETAERFGAFVGEMPGMPRFVQSTGFVLSGDGKVITSVYSSGAIGRLVPEDVRGLVGYLRSHQGK